MIGELDFPVWSVGLMTGTSLDGEIDVALLRTDGVVVEDCGPFLVVPFSDTTRKLIQAADEEAATWQFDQPRPRSFKLAEEALTAEQAGAVLALLEQTDLTSNDVAVVGFHGQTVKHEPPVGDKVGQTLQLGDGQQMSDHCCISVVHDFRSADMRAGGQGAPLAAVYHQARLKAAGLGDETAVLNLGGVANLTWWSGHEDLSAESTLIAFDTGPANAPIDEFVQLHSDQRYDQQGLLAAAGRVDEVLLEKLLQHDYLQAGYPKSLDRRTFNAAMAQGMSLEDGAALLTAFSAACVSKALELLPVRPRQIIVCGGGLHNPALVDNIRQRAQVDIILPETLGWDGDAMEAECFAFLAVRHLRQLPFGFPHTTGVSGPVVGGQLSLPQIY